MIHRKIKIVNKLGLHARAAAKFATEASRFMSNISVGTNGKSVNAKSVMSLMLLAASQGTDLDISADGEDEQAAIEAIATLIQNRFGEDQ